MGCRRVLSQGAIKEVLITTMVLLGAMPFASNGHSISNLDGIRQYGYCEYAATFTCHPCSRQGPSSSRYNSTVEALFCNQIMWVQFLPPAPIFNLLKWLFPKRKQPLMNLRAMLGGSLLTCWGTISKMETVSKRRG